MPFERIFGKEIEKIKQKLNDEKFLEEQLTKLKKEGIEVEKTSGGVQIYTCESLYEGATSPFSSGKEEHYRPVAQLRGKYSKIEGFEVEKDNLVVYFKQRKPSYQKIIGIKQFFL